MTQPDGVRLFIADQSLIDQVGHFYSYDRALALAAREAGLEALVLANRAIGRPLIAAADFPIEPWFSRTWRTDDRHPFIALASSLLRHRPARLTMRLRGGLRQIMPSIDRPTTSGQHPPGADRSPAPLVAALTRAVRHHRITERDVIFLHTIKAGVAAHVIDACDSIAAGAPLRIVCLLRDLPAPAELHALRAAVARRAGYAQSIRLASDSNLLARRLSADLGIDVAEFPIPADLAPATANKPKQSRPFVVGYLGEARVDKGFTLLPDLIETLRKRSSTPIHFAIHATLSQGLPSAEVFAALARIKTLLGPADRLSNAALDTEDFGRWIEACDCIVLPYDVDRYRYATSGILIEALARACPVVVPAQTWMADNLPTAAGVLFDQPQNLARAVCGLIDDHAPARDAAIRAAPAIRQKHSPHNLLMTLLQTAGL